jgi:ribonucleotide monophosphatase NagD (HAD superfamily)
LEAWTCGKPTTTTYDYAEKILEKYYRKTEPDPKNTIKTVYMVGDNPESDICGALLADKNSRLTWQSCLVETGVHKSGTVPEYQPTKTVSDVWEAVRWVVEKESKVDIGPFNDG